MIRNLLPGILWGLIILVLSGMPGNYIPAVQNFADWIGLDKLVHFILYAVFVFALLFGLSRQQQSKSITRIQYYSVIGIGIAFGGVTEVLQNHLFIGRNGNIYDFVADCIGCLVGLIVYLIYQHKKNKESKA